MLFYLFLFCCLRMCVLLVYIDLFLSVIITMRIFVIVCGFSSMYILLWCICCWWVLLYIFYYHYVLFLCLFCCFVLFLSFVILCACVLKVLLGMCFLVCVCVCVVCFNYLMNILFSFLYILFGLISV